MTSSCGFSKEIYANYDSCKECPNRKGKTHKNTNLISNHHWENLRFSRKKSS
jgi:hypothetical protein